jgi:hypothetical protein
MMLRNAYYYPIFVFCLILLIAVFLMGTSQLGWCISEGIEKCIVQRRQAKLFARSKGKGDQRVADGGALATSTSAINPGADGSTEIPVVVGGRTLCLNVDREDIEWHYKDLKEWEESLLKLKKLDIDSLRNLDKFAFFFAKTVNKICTCLVLHEKIP